MDKDKAAVVLQPVEFPEFPPVTYEQWKEEATATLKGAPFEKKLFTKTYEGITLEPIYTAEHAASFGSKDGLPGMPDYLRGSTAAGYIAQPWQIAQASCRNNPTETNAVLKEELARGTTAIAIDGPCECLESFENIKTLLDGVDIANTPFQVFAGASIAPALGLIVKYAAEKDAKISGVIGADPIGMLAADGTLPGRLSSYLDRMAADIKFAAESAPQIKTIYVQGSVYHNGGASAVQELAAAFATAIAYLDAMTERGLSVDEVAVRIQFDFSLGANFFMEIAKIRAARLIWSQIIKAFGGSDQAAKLTVSARTSEFTTTYYDPYVNILRATTQAFSGVLGGVDALSVATFDSAVRCSDEQSRRIARNIQVMLQNEFNAIAPVDPAGGSWYVETLTGQLAEATWKLLQEIEDKGGMINVLQSGWLQEQIAATLNERFKKLATRAEVAVGTNMYPNMQEEPLSGACADDACTTETSGCGCGCGSGSENLAITPIKPRRWTEQYEALRKRTESHKAQTGQNIEVFLANMGPIPQHKARADFSAAFMEVAGFNVLRNDGFATVDDAAKAALASKAQVVVICSTDDTYPEIVPALAAEIKKAAPQTTVVLAGMPAEEYKPAYDAAGVDYYIHMRANCLELLTKIQTAGGMV